MEKGAQLVGLRSSDVSVSHKCSGMFRREVADRTGHCECVRGRSLLMTPKVKDQCRIRDSKENGSGDWEGHKVRKAC